MKPEESILNEVLDRPASERDAFLDHACGADPVLRDRVTALLRGYEGAGAELEKSPLAGPARDARQDECGVPRDYGPGMRIGRYRLLQRLGEGGCGVVFMAEQEEPVRRRVALKVIKLGMDTREVIARFEAERQALALMDHPNIAHVLDAGATETGRPFFVMELVRGGPITRHCDEHLLGAEERVRLFIQLCSAIQHAHQKGLIHRDLKPSNILVTLHDGVPVPKIIDFGIAKAMHGRLTDRTLFTAFEQFIGTPAYMSPEQLEMSGLDVDTRSDIYSLGVLLYELLTGRTPFESRDLLKAGLDEMRRTIREKEPVKPSTRVSTLDVTDGVAIARQRATDPAKLRSWLRGDIDWIVMRCLEKDRRRRYETANGLAMDLQRYLHNEPVVARPPSTGYVLRKLVRRNKLGFTAAAAVLCALVAGLAFSTLSLLRERAARQRADLEAARSAQVAHFMRDILAGVGPQVAIGRDTKLLRAILDHTVVRLNRALPDQPEVEADLRETLGHVYRDLAEYSASALMHERALEMRRKAFGAEHPAVAASLYELGDVLARQGKLGEAETLLRDALVLRERLLGPKHTATSAARAALAHLDLQQRQVTDPQSEKPSLIRVGMSGSSFVGKSATGSVISLVQQKRGLEDEFAADGIRIDWNFYQNQAAITEAYSRGVFDFTNMGPVSAVVSRASGHDYKILLALRRYDPDYFMVVRADSPFRTLADLKGRRLAMLKGLSVHLTLCRILAKHGYTEADFEIVFLENVAAVQTAFNSGLVDARPIMPGESDDSQRRTMRVIYDPGRDPDFEGVGKLCVSGEFERRYPAIVQRVVTTLLKSAAWISSEENRMETLQLWAKSPDDLVALKKKYAGYTLKAWMSPLIDEYFLAGLQRDIDDLKRFKLISPDADTKLEGWVEPKYLNHALRELGLTTFWSQLDANGNPKALP